MKGLRKKVIKDYRFPFKFTDSEYFDYFMDLYKDDFHLEKPWEDLQQAVKETGSEDEFFKYSSGLIETVIADIRSKEEFLNFNSAEMPDMPKRNFEVSKTSPYSKDFDNFELISIDLVKANYQVLKRFDPAIVNGTENYQQFISGYTPHSYFQNSKQIRQIIFGNLNPKRQQAFQKRCMEDVLLKMHETRKDFTFHGLTSDEVFVYVANQFSQLVLEEIKELLKPLDLELRIELFRVISLGKKCFVKEFLGGSGQVERIEFKGLPGHLFAQAYKHYKGLPLNEKDMTFIFEGEKARLLSKTFED